MNPKVTSGRWSQEKLMMAQLKVGYPPYFSVVREDKDTTKREDSFRIQQPDIGRISLDDTMLPGP